MTIDLDLETAGYKLLADDFENGLCGGQADRPELIADALHGQGVERFIFHLDSTGQFDLSFSVWVHESEFDLIDREEFESTPVSGVDPAVQMQKALADASAKMAATDGRIKVAKCDLDSAPHECGSSAPKTSWRARPWTSDRVGLLELSGTGQGKKGGRK